MPANQLPSANVETLVAEREQPLLEFLLENVKTLSRSKIKLTLRSLYEKAGVIWQLCELGKVDQGGGGTIARFMARRNIDTIDAGVPVLSMHAPFEVVSKLDCYMTYKGVLAAYEDR